MELFQGIPYIYHIVHEKPIILIGSSYLYIYFFRPTSDVNISETGYPIYLNVQRVASKSDKQFSRYWRRKLAEKKTQKRDSFLPTLYVPIMFTVGHLIWQ